MNRFFRQNGGRARKRPIQSPGFARIESLEGRLLLSVTANNDAYNTPVDIALSVPTTGVLTNDTDTDAQATLTAVLDSTTTHGQLSLQSDGSFTYTPNASYHGLDTFTYHANDGTSDSNIATVTIAADTAPVAVNDSFGAFQGTHLSIAAKGVLTNDTDTDTDQLTAVLGSTTSHGTLALNPDGSFTYDPTPGFVGADSFTYHANDGFLDSADATVTINVAQATTTTTLSANPTGSTFGASVTFSAVVASAGGTPTGTVTFSDGSTILGTGDLDGAGKATFSSSALSVGSHTITASYASDGNFADSTSTGLPFTVSQASTSTTVSALPTTSNFGDSVTFTAVVASAGGTPTGTVTFSDGATVLGTGDLDGTGKATFSSSALSIGSHSITASYASDGSFGSSTSSALPFTVAQATTTTTLAAVPNPSNVGDSVTFTATVVSAQGTPTGSVTFLDGSTVLGSGNVDGTGHASFATSTLTQGAHFITASYGGDTNFSTSGSAIVVDLVNTAGAVASTTTVTAAPSTPSFGDTITLTATVTAEGPTPGGSVTFMDGNTILGSGTLDGTGTATFSTSSLASGSHAITAVYGGSETVQGSISEVLNFSVAKAATNTTLTALPTSSTYSDSVTFTGVVTSTTGTPTGSISFFDGATLLGTGTLDATGTGTFVTSLLTAGTHTITAVYAGTADFATSTSNTLNYSVAKATTSTALVSSANPSGSGDSVTFSATVTALGGTPTGTVTFMDGSTVLGTGDLNGTGLAQFSTSALSLGTHSITAVYGGDTNFQTSSSNALSQVVKTASTATLTANPTSSTFGSSVAFTVAVTGSAGTPTGSVTFFDGSTNLGTFTLDGTGSAVLTTATLTAGTHSITAVYAGNSTYAGDTSNALSYVVAQATTTTTLTAAPNPSTFGVSVTFTATVVFPAGVSVPVGETVTFKDGATTLGTGVIASNGQATFSTTSLSVASHSITAVYAGDTNIAGSTSTPVTQVVNSSVTPVATTTTVTGSTSVSVYGTTVTFSVTVTGGTPSGTVDLYNISTKLATLTLDASGKASFTTSTLPEGIALVTALYSGNTTTARSVSITPAKVTVTPAGTSISLGTSVTPAASGQAVTISALVTGATGASVPRGVVNFYDGTNLIGSSELNPTGSTSITTSALVAGTHSITAIYTGDSNYGQVTSQVLTQVVSSSSAVAAVTTTGAPSVVSLQRFGSGIQPTVLVLRFNSALDAARATSVAHYHLVGPVNGKRGHQKAIRIKSAVYNASNNTVTLHLARRLPLSSQYQLTVNGNTATGIASASGTLLDGAGTGTPGTNYVAIFGREIFAGPVSAARVAKL